MTAMTDILSDGYAGGTPYKLACRAAATSNVATLSGPQTIDGVALVADDRVLLTAQSNQAFNGPWLVQTGAWVRPSEMNTSAKMKHGMQIRVLEGTKKGTWYLSAPTGGAMTINQTAQTWTREPSSSPFFTDEIDNADSPYTASLDEVIRVNTSNGNTTINLPTAVGNQRRTITVVCTTAGGDDIILDGNGAETVNGGATYVFTGDVRRARTVMSDGAGWIVVWGFDP